MVSGVHVLTCGQTHARRTRAAIAPLGAVTFAALMLSACMTPPSMGDVRAGVAGAIVTLEETARPVAYRRSAADQAELDALPRDALAEGRVFAYACSPSTWDVDWRFAVSDGPPPAEGTLIRAEVTDPERGPDRYVGPLDHPVIKRARIPLEPGKRTWLGDPTFHDPEPWVPRYYNPVGARYVLKCLPPD